MTEGNGEVRKLPKGWCFTTAIEACIKVIDCHNKTAPYIDAGIKLVRTTNIRNGSIDLTNTKFVDQSTYGFWSRRCPPEPGDILFTREAPMAEVGMIPPEEKLCMGQRMMLLRTDNKNLLAKYLLYALQSPYIHRYAEKVAVGTGVKHMRVRDVELLPILVAPLFEQHRIVEKIEELFSDLDQGIESLKTAQKQLKVYRQAVLKWAFEGKLTEEWRKQHASTLKTGEALLAQIKAERENRYQQQLAEWEEKVQEWVAIGKVGKKPSKPQKPKELPPLGEKEIADIPKLPETWKWVQLGEFLENIEAGKSFSCDERPPKNDETGVAKVSAVTWGTYDELESKTCLEEDRIEEKFLIESGDFLFSRANTIELVGACVIAQQVSLRVMLSDKTLRFKFPKKINQKFILHFLRSRYGRNEIERLSTGNQESMRNIGQERILRIKTPFPSFTEQEQIVEEIESRLSICDQLEATIIENLQQAEALRQSILKQAFEGKLVPQDPNDEPAEKLLERIKAERQVNGNTGKKSKPPHQQLTLQEL